MKWRVENLFGTLPDNQRFNDQYRLHLTNPDFINYVAGYIALKS